MAGFGRMFRRVIFNQRRFNRMKPFGYFVFFFGVFLAGSTLAQTMLIQNGRIVSNGGHVQASAEQKLMLSAPEYIYKQDYRGAEMVYSQVIAMNDHHISAYIQRGLVRREMGDGAGAMEDGRAAVILANEALQTNPNEAYLYYQRGSGFRLLKQFSQARTDIQYAMRLRGDQSWDLDLKAIDLEEKMAQ